MIDKNVKLWIGKRSPVHVFVSQFDTIWRFVFTIIYENAAWSVPNNATAILYGLMADGSGFEVNGTVQNGRVIVETSSEMTGASGAPVCEVVIFTNGKRVGTSNFFLNIEERP